MAAFSVRIAVTLIVYSCISNVAVQSSEFSELERNAELAAVDKIGPSELLTSHDLVKRGAAKKNRVPVVPRYPHDRGVKPQEGQNKKRGRGVKPWEEQNKKHGRGIKPWEGLKKKPDRGIKPWEGLKKKPDRGIKPWEGQNKEHDRGIKPWEGQNKEPKNMFTSFNTALKKITSYMDWTMIRLKGIPKFRGKVDSVAAKRALKSITGKLNKILIDSGLLPSEMMRQVKDINNYNEAKLSNNAKAGARLINGFVRAIYTVFKAFAKSPNYLANYPNFHIDELLKNMKEVLEEFKRPVDYVLIKH